MEYAYIATALAIGALLYWRRPGLYVAFVWWLWFLTPEVRRLIDYAQGWNPVNPVMLTPYLVSALTFFTLVYHLPKLRLDRYFPFILIFSGLFFAYAVGAYRNGVTSASYHLIEWLVPVVFAYYLIVHWRRYPVFRRVVTRTFVLGVLVMGLYGVLQYFALPAWDQYWMESAPITSIGQPEPFEVRVFSTLNSPNPFALVMMAGLLLLSGGGGFLRWPAAMAGYVSFLLSLVRSAWGGWLVGLLFIVTQRRGSRTGLVATLLVTTLIALPALTVGPVAERINERLKTLTELEQDNSFNARVEFYVETLPQVFLSPLGEGFGSTGRSTKLDASGGIGELGENAAFDSGIMEIPFVLGLPGAVFYMGGLIWLLTYALRSRGSKDFFAATSCSIAVVLLVLLIFNDTIDGVVGMLFWSFLGLAIAASQVERGQILKEGRGKTTLVASHVDTEDLERRNLVSRR